MDYINLDNDIENRIKELISSRKIKRMLDYGCGSGELLEKMALEFPNLELMGTDYFSKFGKDFTPKNVDNRINYLDRSSEDFITLSEKESFDLIISSFTLHHFQYPIRELKSMEKMLISNGVLFILDFSFRMDNPDAKVKNILSFFDEIRSRFQRQYHRHHYTLTEIEDVFLALNLKQLKLEELVYEMSASDKEELKGNTIAKILKTKKGLSFAPEFERSFFEKIASLEESLMDDYTIERNSIIYSYYEKA